MSLPSQRGLAILGMAMLLGILGDALLRATPWGLNLPLWMGVAAATGWAFLPDPAVGRNRVSVGPLLTAMFFALCFAWRDANFLRFWNAVAILCAVALPALQLQGVRLRVARVTEYAAGIAASGVNAIFGAPILAFHDVRWRALPGPVRKVRAVSVGVVLTFPILLVFGGLLTSADPGFERIVRTLVVWDFSTLASHLLVAGFIAWAATGYLRTLATANDPVLALGNAAFEKASQRPRLGIVELGIPLAALGLTFLVFVILQASYLFGGEAVIMETAGLTYAEHARGGFFELVTAATLLLPVLHGAEWLLDTGSPRNVRIFRTLAATLLVLIALIMLSAIQRMRLYVDVYGLTQDRFYALAFMTWVGAVLANFGATVLRGRPNRFAFGAVTTGFATLAALNIVNPDAFIARTNLARAEAGAEFDLAYVDRLGADAIPELLRRAPPLLSAGQCDAFRGVVDREAGRPESDWRSWNLARIRARRAVAGAGAVRCEGPGPGSAGLERPMACDLTNSGNPRSLECR